MSRRRDSIILRRILNEISYRQAYTVVDEVKDVLSRIESILVITNRKSYSGIVDNEWYIGTTDYLNLVENHLFKYFKNLRCLRLHYNITEFNICKRLGLREEYIGFKYNMIDKEITRLPDEIGELVELVTLDISYTSIVTLPDTMVNLSKLQFLFLDRTLIEEIPLWIGSLRSLQVINLSNTKLHSIPKAIMDLGLPFKDNFRPGSWEKGIYIRNTILMTQPMSLFYQNRDLIEKYYESEKVELHESKVILMGDGGAGKSYTIKRIVNNGKLLREDTQLTHSITIDYWDDRNQIVGFEGTIDFWDFGGQDIYLSIHRCFLTERSCYVIILSNRQYGSHRGLMRQARYWLKTITPYAKDSPILIAINTWSGQSRDGISISDLREEFPKLNIVDQIVYNAKDKEGGEFNRITGCICKMAQESYSYALQFPKSWNTVRNRLSIEYAKENTISEKEYFRICEEEMLKSDGFYDKEIARWLLSWFNDLGYCFDYHETEDDPEEEYHVLKPQWVINAMYKIINYKIDRQLDCDILVTDNLSKDLAYGERYSDGIIPQVDIIDALTDRRKVSDVYSKKEALYIIKILRRFKVAYLLDENKFLFIPALCSDIRPEGFDNGLTAEKKIEYLIRFKYLPDTVIHHLMIKCYRNHTRIEKVWKYGFHFYISNYTEKDSALLVVEMLNDTEIRITYYNRNDNQDISGLYTLRSWLADVYKELGIEGVRDYIIRRTPLQNARIDVIALIDAYIRNPKIKKFYCQDDGVYQGYSVDKLLKDLFGHNYQEKIERMYMIAENSESLSKLYTSMSIAENIEARFRTQFIVPPKNEKEVQEQLQKFFDAQGYKKGIDYERESGKFQFSGREYIPDFVFRTIGTVIETKIIKDKSKKNRIIEEINADCSAYTKEYIFLIFLVYDIGCVSDVEEFKRDFEEKGNIKVVVIKH